MLAIVIASLASLPAWAGTSGGGFLGGGLHGEYYNTTTLPDVGTTGTFSRSDVRLNFDWGTALPIGGSNAEPYASFPLDNFSIRWTGGIVARYSETYTFYTTAKDGVRLYLRPAGNGAWTTVIDNWPAGGQSTTTTSGTFAMTASNSYDIKVEYRALTGSATMILKWASPSLPLEIIDPAANVAVNYGTYREEMFADALQCGRNHYETASGYSAPTPDADGWPTNEFNFIISETLIPYDISPLETGYLRVSFKGRATVTAFGNCSVVSGSFSYDAGTNTTTGYVNGVDNSINVLQLNFRSTDRDGVYTNGLPDCDGVTDLKIMRPAYSGATTSLPETAMLHPKFRTALDRMTQLRFQRTNDQAVSWSDRTPPYWALMSKTLPYVYNSRYNGGAYNLTGNTGLAHEVEIMICNELGCDYYVTVPHLASTGSSSSYMQKLAKLVRYGSDADGEPYSEPTANPAYPPLNPNLNCYIEVSNELWNYLAIASYAPYFDYRELIEDKADANDADFQILNFDGLATTLDSSGYYVNNYTWVRRYWALKLKQVSDDFRTVWGDSEMPGGTNSQPRIRPYFTWQYADANASGSTGLLFLDSYYNNLSGTHVAVPHPPSYYFWCAGGAGYYSSSNSDGFVTSNPIPDSGFETPVTGTFSLRPTGGSWTFANNAGIASLVSRSSVMTAATLGSTVTDRSDWVGCKFTVGASPITVYELGRWVSTGNTKTHAVDIVRASDGAIVTSANVNANVTAGAFAYARCYPITLAANTTYYLLSQEASGADAVGNSASTVTPASGVITVGLPATATLSGTTWTFTDGSGANTAWGPVSFKYAAVQSLASGTPLNQPDPMEGTQMAWLQNVGGVQSRADVTFTIPATQTDNHYALSFRWAQRTQSVQGTPDTAAFKVYAVVNGTTATITPLDTATQPQQWRPSSEWKRVNWWVGNYFFSEYFTAPAGATVKIRFEGNNASGDYCAFLDDVLLTSADAFYAGDIPSTGAATGQTAGTYLGNQKGDSKLCAPYGLVQMTYEHGYSAGGDSGSSPIQNYCKFSASGARQSMVDCMRIFQQSGGFIPTMGTYSMWPIMETIGGVRVDGIQNVAAYPLIQGIDDMLALIPYAPTNGFTIPATIAGTSYTLSLGGTATPWKSYDIVVTTPGTYAVGVDTTSGGTLELALDGTTVLATGSSGVIHSGNVYLGYGIHGIRVRTVSGSFTISRVIVDAATQAPASPTPATGSVSGVTVSLAWSDNSSGSSQELWFELQRATDSTFTTNLTSYQVAAGVTSWTDPTQLAVSTTYYYRVRGYNLAGASDWANVNSGNGVYVAVPAPSNVLFAYDPVDSSACSLSGFTGGTGWSAGWYVQNNDVVTPGYEVRTTSPLSYSGLTTQGSGYIIGGRAYLASGRSFNLTNIPYYFKKTVSSTTYVGADGTTVWFSALVRVDKANTTGQFITLVAGSTPQVASTQKAGVIISNGKWAIRVRDASSNWVTTESTISATTGQTVLLVLKAEFGSSDIVSLYVDPGSLGGDAPATPSATYTTAGDVYFSSWGFYPDEATEQGSMDELRFGDSYAAVTPTPNRAPSFTSTPFSKSDATEDSAYSASIATDASDPDTGNTLTFSKISGPAWLSVASNGALSGTPANSDVGTNSFVVRVTDQGGLYGQATMNIVVVNVNDAPAFAADPFAADSATQDQAYSSSIAASASDPDTGDTVTFSKVSGPSWLSVASGGALSGTPVNANVGTNTFVVRVTDAGGLYDDATMTVNVVNVNDAPSFTSTTLVKAAGVTSQAYSGSIASDATDPDSSYGDTLTFSKVSGAAWLSVASNGALSGTPASGDIGINTFTVRVTDAAGLYAEAALSITTFPAPQNTVFSYDPVDVATGVLYGVSSGTGWSGAWGVQNNDTTTPGFEIRSTTPLTYTGLATQGSNYIVGGRAYLTANHLFDLSGVPSYFKKTVNSISQVGADGGTVWLSALVRADKANTSGLFLILATSTAAQVSGDRKVVTSISNGKWAIGVRDANNNLVTTESSVSVTTGQTYLLVLKLTFGAKDTVSLYVNPASLGGDAPATPSATYTTAGDIYFRNLGFYPDESTEQGSLDEVRFGDSFAAVTPTN